MTSSQLQNVLNTQKHQSIEFEQNYHSLHFLSEGEILITSECECESGNVWRWKYGAPGQNRTHLTGNIRTLSHRKLMLDQKSPQRIKNIREKVRIHLHRYSRQHHWWKKFCTDTRLTSTKTSTSLSQFRLGQSRRYAWFCRTHLDKADDAVNPECSEIVPSKKHIERVQENYSRKLVGKRKLFKRI